MPSKSSTSVEELKIGPFAGGINTYSDPAMIADDEMVDCVNFDLSLDGSLVSRPPWSVLNAQKFSNTSSGSNAPESSQIIIGTGVYEGNRFVIVNSTHSGSAASYIYYVDGINAGTLALIANGAHSKAHRYSDDIYLVPDINSTGQGVKYDLAGGLVTLIASMPQGYASTVYKERLFISGRRGVSNSSRLYFSDLADFADWPGTNFFDINPGDGDAVNDLVVYQDNLVIFKDNATYVLAYDTGPAQAVLQVINTDIGAMGRNCVDVYENSIFILKYNQVYEMSNYDFVRVSVKIPFEYDETLPSVAPYQTTGQAFKYPFWLRVVGDRAVVRFYNRLYIYHLRLRGWTRWDSEDTNIKYLGPIMRLDNTNTNLLRGFDTYVATTTLRTNIDAQGPGATGAWNSYFKILKMEDRYNLSNTENGNITPIFPAVDIKLSMMTKQFDIGLSHRFKRLMHWGLNCYTARDVTGTLFPYSVAYKVTWNQLNIYHWHELNTWEYPLTAIPGVTQDVSGDSGKQVKFIRFPKSLRFRLLQFKIEMVTQGNTTDGPAYVYNITAFVAAKQLMPKAVN
jgi:hypothetical protein